MPKSRRNRVVPLTVVKKKTKEWKGNKIEEVRSLLDKHKNVFLFSVDNMRTDKMQKVREDWKGSRFFMGKNKVVKVALGRNAAEEYKDGLNEVGNRLVGHRGLLFTDHSRQEVMKYFNNFSSPEFARTGSTATQTVKLDAGPLEQFPFSMEQRLRDLGMDVILKKGVVELEQDFTVCKKGKALSSESARLLELLGIEMAEFKVNIEGMWSEPNGFIDFKEDLHKITTPVKEKKKVKKSSKTVAPETPLRRSTRNKIKTKATVAEEDQPDVVMEDEEPETEFN